MIFNTTMFAAGAMVAVAVGFWLVMTALDYDKSEDDDFL
jgi:hypothetical protein